MAQWLTVGQVAAYLQMSRDKVYDMVRQGELPGCRIRQQWRFDREEVDTWVHAQRPVKPSSKVER
jgi:excisionase family DNA binding protein